VLATMIMNSGFCATVTVTVGLSPLSMVANEGSKFSKLLTPSYPKKERKKDSELELEYVI